MCILWAFHVDEVSPRGIASRFYRPWIWMRLDGGRARLLDSEICELGESTSSTERSIELVCENANAMLS